MQRWEFLGESRESALLFVPGLIGIAGSISGRVSFLR
jgi:hypothetical protein